MDMRQERIEEGKRERVLLNNGRRLLVERIASCDGRSSNPIRTFSAKDLFKATNNFDSYHLVSKHGYFKMYKGSLEDRPILVKKYVGESGLYTSRAIRDIVIASQMSNHKNVLKLLGCCLEFETPALVCEYAGAGVLADHLYSREGGRRHDGSLSWKSRIKIAKDIANAVTYLHTAFPRPIIHRILSPSIVFLDEHDVAKLSGFSRSISIPHGESRVKNAVTGPWPFVDPEYEQTGYVTEKVDVYSFGLLLLVLLTGQKFWDADRRQGHVILLEYVKHYVREDRFNDIVDPKILGEGGGIEQERQLQSFVQLAFQCTSFNGEDRPTMIDVAKELQRIERSIAILPC